MAQAEHTGCVIVGAGPAGTILALLLARSGLPVTLLEAHLDFDREFRGDTIHPSVLGILGQLGLVDHLLELRHSKVRHVTVQTAAGAFTPIDFRGIPARYPYIALLPQTEFLRFITDEAARYPGFRLEMGARVQELVEEDGIAKGVRIRTGEGDRDLRAPLIVAADGRFSTVRRLAGMEAIATAPPMDVLWFRLPKVPGDPEDEGGLGRIGQGHILILLDRWDYWQVGYVIPKDGYRQIRESGIETFRQAVAVLAPEFTDRLNTITEWQDISFLSVTSDRLPRWYRPGLLFIGDAAHTMSPMGGVGINYAIQDAVEAANVLAAALPSRRGNGRAPGESAAPSRMADAPDPGSSGAGSAAGCCPRAPPGRKLSPTAPLPNPPRPLGPGPTRRMDRRLGLPAGARGSLARGAGFVSQLAEQRLARFDDQVADPIPEGGYIGQGEPFRGDRLQHSDFGACAPDQQRAFGHRIAGPGYR